MTELVTKLVSVALPGDRRSTYDIVKAGNENVLAMLKLLESKNIVKALVETPGYSSWQLTSDGVRELSPRAQLTNPRPIFQPNLDIPIEEWTHYDMIMWLSINNWTHRMHGTTSSKGRRLHEKRLCHV